LRWDQELRRELENRGLFRAQAFGEAFEPDRLDKLARYEVHLDRKLERILGMLLRLQDLRRTIAPGPFSFLVSSRKAARCERPRWWSDPKQILAPPQAAGFRLQRDGGHGSHRQLPVAGPGTSGGRPAPSSISSGMLQVGLASRSAARAYFSSASPWRPSVLSVLPQFAKAMANFGSTW
jgi:hypothetical protein